MYLIGRLFAYLISWVKGLFRSGKEPQPVSMTDKIESEIMDERLQVVQANEDNKIAEHIMFTVARLLKQEVEPREALDKINEMEHPEYNIWHEEAARYKGEPIEDHIYNAYVKHLNNRK